jgi:hypothetical protein
MVRAVTSVRRSDDDVLIERDDQHCERQQRQRRRPAVTTTSIERGSFIDERHSGTPLHTDWEIL